MKRPLKRDRDATQVDCVEAMRALADPNRLKIMDQLLRGPRNVTWLADSAGLTAYNASRNLSMLARAGLVSKEKKGQQRIYRLSTACEVLVDKKKRTLNLGCCQFRFDALVDR
ncbi:MAG: winged helix-turn-helix transcriptional regulator [Planctomycetes bacterium]|nr:winged helix-turn-helix transcriptional regulator [Planctomycetota bacterium]